MVLPNDPTKLAAAQTRTVPSRTWFIDRDTMRIRGECDGLQAVKQAVDIIMNTIRFKWQIYSPSSGMEYDNLIGQDSGYVAIELQRRIIDALSVDTRITGITDYDYETSDGSLFVSFTVRSIFGDINESMEVTLL